MPKKKVTAPPRKPAARAAKGGSAKARSAKPSAAKKPAAPPKRSASAAKPRPAAAAPSYESGKWAAAFTPRTAGERRYWLLKTEPTSFSFDDLLHAKDQTTYWDGVRNFAARNFMRDGMKLGDRAFFYHSMGEPPAIVGICEVVREGYPDHTAFDAKDAHYDPASDPAAPMWYMVDVRAVEPLATPVTLAEIKASPALAEMALVRIGRLSVTPVTAAEWKTICAMGGVKG